MPLFPSGLRYDEPEAAFANTKTPQIDLRQFVFCIRNDLSVLILRIVDFGDRVPVAADKDESGRQAHEVDGHEEDAQRHL